LTSFIFSVGICVVVFYFADVSDYVATLLYKELRRLIKLEVVDVVVVVTAADVAAAGFDYV